MRKQRDVGLMLIDTSRPGWTVLHADCVNPRIDGSNAEQLSLWDLFKVPDIVRPRPLLTSSSCSCSHAGRFSNEVVHNHAQ